MSKSIPEITPELHDWLKRQHVFFVATAPLSGTGLVNCSPKGGEDFRVCGPLSVAYLDYTGSGAETAAHVRENGRIILMFCAFEGAPKIVRLQGQGEVLEPGHPGFAPLASQFPPNPGVRSIIRVTVRRVSASCGYSVPLFDYRADRTTLDEWAAAKGPEGLRAYRQAKNTKSLDGLPAFPAS